MDKTSELRKIKIRSDEFVTRVETIIDSLRQQNANTMKHSEDMEDLKEMKIRLEEMKLWVQKFSENFRTIKCERLANERSLRVSLRIRRHQ